MSYIIGMKYDHEHRSWHVVYCADPDPDDPTVYFNAGILEIRSNHGYVAGMAVNPEAILARYRW